MNDLKASAGSLFAKARDKAEQLYRSHKARKTALIVAIVLVVYGLLGFFAAPPIIRAQIQKHASAALGREVTVGHVRFDPYTLRLQLDQLQVAGRAGQPPFITVERAVINASWTSLFRMAPVLDVLELHHPQIRIARSAPGQFNFSDILERLAAEPSSSRSPFRYSVSNITVDDGAVGFADAVTHSTHQITNIDIGIPFLANLPRDADIYVQPLLAMNVDGSPLRITGNTKPFANSRESDITFTLRRLDLPRYLAYAPTPLPFSIPAGFLSGDLTLHFAATTTTPQLRLSGNLLFDNLTLDSNQKQPILALKQGSMQLTDVEPLLSRYGFGAIRLDGAQLWYTQTGVGHSNLDSLLAPSRPSATPAQPTDLRIASLALTDSTFHYADADKHTLDLNQLHGNIAGLSLTAAPPAKLDLAGQLDGGSIAARGTLDLAASELAAALTLQNVGLAPLQGVAGMPLDGHTADGKLSAAGNVKLDWAKALNVQLAKAQASVSDFALAPHAKGGTAPIAWQKLDATLDAFDLATQTATVSAVMADGLKLDVQRLADKRINLLQLFASPAQHGARGKPSPWHWSVAHVGFKNSAVAFTDDAAGPKPVKVQLDKLDGSLGKLDDKLDAVSPVKLSGAIGRGTFNLAGTLRPSPLEANLQVETTRLGIADLEPYIGVPLNVTLSRAQVTSHGKLRYDARGATPQIAYRGDASLDNVSIQDKLTGDDFLRWRTLAASNLDANYGPGTPRVTIGHLALTAFYARMIINANGRLNLSDVIANPAAQPVSVTRANESVAAAPSPAAVSTAAITPSTASAAAGTAANATASATPAAPAADIHIGGITLAYGQLNYTDDFIKPNYTANLTKLHGKIGAFGTQANAAPAAITLEAALNDNAPVAINGTMNPLQPEAQLDVTGKAEGVELARVSTYATQYTGYPITGGELTANVHYTLDQRKLSADNHFFITQLTFGDRVESPGVRHLPVKLAVALLKDSQGNVNIDLPVSGSLNDPQFSIGGLVWRAFVGLIGKAVTAPFRLLSAAFGGGHHEDLDYVVFAPGSAVLDANAQSRLKQIATMLQQKPALKLQITGRVDPAKDVAGLRKVTVDNLIRRAKVQDTEGKHANVSDTALAAVEITPDEYEKYLKRAYKTDDFKGKPRDYLGLKLPKLPEMRKLMADAVPTDQKALQALAERRADAVRAWLVADKFAGSRIAIEAPKLNAEGIGSGEPTTRAQFGIAQ